jgi:hypothetical protein
MCQYFKTLALQIFKRARVKKGKLKENVNKFATTISRVTKNSFIQIKVGVN